MDEVVTFQGGGVAYMIVWDVGRSKRYPGGLKYRLFYVKEERTLVGYDNHHPKGPHRHVEGKEEPYRFESLDKLERDFREDVRRAGGVWP